MNAESEFPARQWPDVPLWTENYCYVCYDPNSEIGIWTHLGRAPFDPTLWRELSMIFLPSGERLVNKGYGRSETARGPGGATLSYECVEPWTEWRSRRDGAAIRTTVKELDSGMLFDRAHERVAFDLNWQGQGPVKAPTTSASVTTPPSPPPPTSRASPASSGTARSVTA